MLPISLAPARVGGPATTRAALDREPKRSSGAPPRTEKATPEAPSSAAPTCAVGTRCPPSFTPTARAQPSVAGAACFTTNPGACSVSLFIRAESALTPFGGSFLVDRPLRHGAGIQRRSPSRAPVRASRAPAPRQTARSSSRPRAHRLAHSSTPHGLTLRAERGPSRQPRAQCPPPRRAHASVEGHPDGPSRRPTPRHDAALTLEEPRRPPFGRSLLAPERSSSLQARRRLRRRCIGHRRAFYCIVIAVPRAMDERVRMPPFVSAVS